MNDLEPGLLAACAALGMGAGCLGGLLGIGGGIVIVPALLLLFQAQGMAATVIAPVAVATSLASIIATSLAATRAQVRRGCIDWQIVRRWTPALLLGSLISGPLANRLPSPVLPCFIGVSLLLIALLMLSAWRPASHRPLPRGIGSFGLGSATGLLSGLAGIGGGSLIIPTLIYFNVPTRLAMGTSSALGLPIAIAGTSGFALAGLGHPDLPPVGVLGFIHVPVAIILALFSFVCAPLGVALAHKIPTLPLRRIFAMVLLATSVHLLWNSISLL